MTATLDSKFDQLKLSTRFLKSYCEHDIACEAQVKTEKWRRVKKLGEGGYGAVWLERNEEGQLRAVKQIPKEEGWQDKFNERELLAMTKLCEYPEYFVRLLGWFEDDESIYFAMEYIEHGDLSNLLRKYKVTEGKAAIITRQLLEGMKIMHDNSFCHRDLKAENVLVVSLSLIKVKISDFGLSKRVVDGTELRTEVGTENYIAPEIIGLLSSRSSYSNAVDMWSLGCLVYYMLTKKMPFPTMRRLNHYITTGVFPEIDLADSNASLAATEFIVKLMERQPVDRLTPEQALEDPWLRIRV